MLTPAGIEVRVRGIQKDGKAADQAAAGERCALNLTGVDVAQVARGDWVASPALHAPTQRMDVRLRVLESEARPLRHWTPVHLHRGRRRRDGADFDSPRRPIKPGESAIVQLVTESPVAALNGDRFIIRDQSALRTLGGGVVIDPVAQRQRRSAEIRLAQLAALEAGDPVLALQALQACSPGGVNLDWLARIFNLDGGLLSSLVAASKLDVIGKEPRIGLPHAAVEAINSAVAQSLARFHAETPQALGFEIAALRKLCAPHLPAPVFATLLRLLADQKKIEVTGSVARLPRHIATANPVDEKMWRTVQPLLDGAGFAGMTVAELAAAASIREPLLKDFLHRKAKTGDVVKATESRFYLRGTLAAFAEIATGVSKALPGGKFSAAQVRDRTDIGRGRAIEILECLDRLGITRRTGDLRRC